MTGNRRVGLGPRRGVDARWRRSSGVSRWRPAVAPRPTGQPTLATGGEHATRVRRAGVNRRGRPGRRGSNGPEPGPPVDPVPPTATRPDRKLWRRRAVGTVATLASLGISAAVLTPFRPSLSVATTGLVLVVPVVVGVAIGGFFVGVAAVALGFLLWDYLFIPPYRTLAVTQAQDWVALAVYAVVMLVVARVVANLEAARALARAPAPLATRAVRRWLRAVGATAPSGGRAASNAGADRQPPSLADVRRVLVVAAGEAVATEITGGWRVRRSRGRLMASPPSATRWSR
jgi:hypothetical protein